MVLHVLLMSSERAKVPAGLGQGLLWVLEEESSGW